MEMPSASHLIFIPTVLIVGVVIGWILGSKAAQDAIAAELRRREAKASQASGPKPQASSPKPQA